jgi:hypothetical protein
MSGIKAHKPTEGKGRNLVEVPQDAESGVQPAERRGY